MMNRRALAGTVALGALAACTAGSPSATSVLKVFNQFQFILPFFDIMAAGIAIAVPSTAPVIALATPYLDEAGTAFQALSITMTDAQAKPVAAQIKGYVDQGAAIISKVITSAAPGSKLAQFQPKLAQANAVLQLIEAFVTSASNVPKAGAKPMALPLLHA